MKQEMDAKNLIKFILGTLFGVFFVLVPFNFDGTVDTILFYYVKLFVKQFNSQLSMVLMICIIASAAISLFNLFNDKTFLGQNRLMKKLFVTSPFYVVNRIIGAVLTVMIYFQIGPSFLISADTGGSMLSLATQLAVIVPSMLLFQTFILEFGGMEFLGEFIGKLVKPLFKVSEICATSIISAWIGPGNAAIMATKELFENGYFTFREAAAIASHFTTGSIGWIVVVSSVLGVMDYFGLILAGLLVVSIIVAVICVRIPPVSLYEDVYVDGTTEFKHVVLKEGNALTRGLHNAANRASEAGVKNFAAKIDNMTFYVFWLTPIIICWGTAALVIALFTPVLGWISLPLELIMNLFGVKEAGIAASAIMSGLADNYLPVIIGGSIQAASTKVIVAMMSILSIIYLSETATLLSSTKIIKKFWQTILIFLERTYNALPFVILFVKVFM